MSIGNIIGASLSEPHINGVPMRIPYIIYIYIYIYIVVRRSYLLRIDGRIRLPVIIIYARTTIISIAHHRIRSPADIRNNTLCAMTLVLLRRGQRNFGLCHVFT